MANHVSNMFLKKITEKEGGGNLIHSLKQKEGIKSRVRAVLTLIFRLPKILIR